MEVMDSVISELMALSVGHTCNLLNLVMYDFHLTLFHQSGSRSQQALLMAKFVLLNTSIINSASSYTS